MNLYVYPTLIGTVLGNYSVQAQKYLTLEQLNYKEIYIFENQPTYMQA